MPHSALLDANVLFPNALRDTLLRIAATELYRPLWSRRILEEVRRNVLAQRSHVAPERFDRTLRLMNEAFPDALISGFESLEPSLAVHPKDRHVLAAAVAGRADALVTFNLKDFPLQGCEPFGVEAQHPDEFLRSVHDLAPAVVTHVIAEQAAATGRHGHPALTVADVLAQLARCGVPEFARTTATTWDDLAQG